MLTPNSETPARKHCDATALRKNKKNYHSK
jgi:hypothetical protein